MKRIVIQGAGFTDNFGDVLFYDIFLKESIKRNVEVDFISLSDNVQRHLTYKQEKKESMLKKIKRADGIVFIGGGYLGEQPYPTKWQRFKWGVRTIKNILYLVPLSMILRKKIIVIGPGAGPVTNPITRFIIKLMGNYSEKTIVRDFESYKYLESIGVKKSNLLETVDTAILLENYYRIEAYSEVNQKSIILHLSQNPKHSVKTMMIVNEVDDFLVRHPNYKLKAITDHNGGGQNEAITFLKNKYKKNIEIHEYETPEKLINYINQSSVVITNKLHIAIVSATLRKSVISIPNHPKVLRFFKQINEQGRCIPFEEIKEGQVNNLLEKYHTEPIELRAELFQKAKRNIEYFKRFVEDKETSESEI